MYLGIVSLPDVKRWKKGGQKSVLQILLWKPKEACTGCLHHMRHARVTVRYITLASMLAHQPLHHMALKYCQDVSWLCSAASLYHCLRTTDGCPLLAMQLKKTAESLLESIPSNQFQIWHNSGIACI